MAMGRIGRTLALLGTATAGLVVAHELDYRFVVPDPLHRHDLLLRSGHGYLTHAGYLALVAGLVAIFASVALGYLRGRGAGALPPARSIAARLAIVQSASFVILETVERIVVGAPPDDRLLALTVVGIMVQLVAALGGAMLITVLDRAGHAIAVATAHRPAFARPSSVAVPAPAVVRAPASRVLLTAPRRGPPALAASPR